MKPFKPKIKKILCASSMIIGIVFVATALFVPFLLPKPIYQVIYGWRYPKQLQAGDGVVKDAGPRSAIHRYTCGLGRFAKNKNNGFNASAYVTSRN